MKLSELTKDLGITAKNFSEDCDIASVSSKISDLTEQSLFVCLRGTKNDGHDYINEAYAKGAFAVVICDISKAPENGRYILVENTRYALSLLLSNFYENPERSFRIIAITGTNGKTSVCRILSEIIRANGYKVGTLSTTGNYVCGVPIENFGMTTPDPEDLFCAFKVFCEAKCDFVVMEASSHALFLDKLSFLDIELAIFTNLSRDHLAFHKDFYDYAMAKAKLFSLAKASLINIDSPYADLMLHSANIKYTYSQSNPASDFYAGKIEKNGSDGIEYSFIKSGKHSVKFKTPGIFSLYNTLAAISASMILKMDIKKTLIAVSDMNSIEGRLEKIDTSKFASPFCDVSVYIDFAHTPDALENILKTARQFCRGRLILVFGCGGNRDRSKRPIMGRVASENADMTIITSDNPRFEDPEKITSEIEEGFIGENKKIIVSRKEAIEYALSISKAGDVILLCGKGHEDYYIDKDGKHPFCERDVVLEYLESMS